MTLFKKTFLFSAILFLSNTHKINASAPCTVFLRKITGTTARLLSLRIDETSKQLQSMNEKLRTMEKDLGKAMTTNPTKIEPMSIELSDYNQKRMEVAFELENKKDFLRKSQINEQ